MHTRVRSAAPATVRFDAAPWVASAIALAVWYGVFATLSHPGLAAGSTLSHAVGVVWQLVISAFEAAALLALVSGRRVRAPFGRMVAALLVCSLAQAAVVALQAIAWDSPEWRMALAPLAGAGVHWPPGVPRDGLALAWGQAGALTLLRIAATAEWLRHAGVSRARAWISVSACYVAVRLLTWWCADLLRGASPLG